MFGVADINKALVTSPVITMKVTFENRDMATIDLLQRLSPGIWGDFCVDQAIAFEDTEGNSFRSSPAIVFTTNSTGFEVGFTDFILTYEGSVEGALISKTSAYPLVDRVDRTNTEHSQIRSLGGRMNKGEET